MSKLFDRAKQYAGEKLMDSEKTPFDPDLLELFTQIDLVKDWSDKLYHKIEELVQPNPALRAEVFINEKLDIKSPERMTTIEHFGTILEQSADSMKDFLSENSFKLNKLIGITEKRIGAGDLSDVSKGRKSLDTIRLDLDICKNKVKKAKPVDVRNAEAALSDAQHLFDKEVEYVRTLIQKTIKAFETLQKSCLSSFIKLQIDYFTESKESLIKLREKLNDQIN